MVLLRRHVDEVDDDQAADVAQTQLAGDLVRRFEIGVQRRLFDVGAFRGACRVDVDGHQRFGGIDDDAAARLQLHLVVKGGFDLAFDLVAVEQRHRIVVELDALLVLRHDPVDELVGALEGIATVDQHFADVRAQAIAHGTDDDVVLLVEQDRRAHFLCGALNPVVKLEQIVQIPLQILGVSVDASGAHDEPHALGQVDAR